MSYDHSRDCYYLEPSFQPWEVAPPLQQTQQQVMLVPVFIPVQQSPSPLLTWIGDTLRDAVKVYAATLAKEHAAPSLQKKLSTQH